MTTTEKLKARAFIEGEILRLPPAQIEACFELSDHIKRSVRLAEDHIKRSVRLVDKRVGTLALSLAAFEIL